MDYAFIALFLIYFAVVYAFMFAKRQVLFYQNITREVSFTKLSL